MRYGQTIWKLIVVSSLAAWVSTTSAQADVTVDSVTRDADTVSITGTASFVDQPFQVIGQDEPDDAFLPYLSAQGMDITGAAARTMTNGTVQLQWQVSELPPSPLDGFPATVYGWTFCGTADGRCFEIHAGRTGVLSLGVEPYGDIFECTDDTCSEFEFLHDGLEVEFDSEAKTITIDLPPDVWLPAGATISPVYFDSNGPAFVSPGEASLLPLYDFGDGTNTEDYSVPGRSVRATVAPSNSNPETLFYATSAALAGNNFSAAVPVGGQTGDLSVFVRSCFGSNNCSYAEASLD